MSTPLPAAEPLHRQDLPNLNLKDGELHLGVTGHRDPLDEKEVRNRVGTELEYLAERYKPGKIVLHTGKAEGADKWVEETLEEIRGESPWALKSIENLPCECEEKMKYCGKCSASYFEKNCDLIIALTCGNHSHLPGGTTDILEQLLRPKSQKPARLQAVMMLTVRRTSQPFPALEPFTWQTRLPQISIPRKRNWGWWVARRWHLWALSALFFLTITLGMIGKLCSKAEKEGANTPETTALTAVQQAVSAETGPAPSPAQSEEKSPNKALDDATFHEWLDTALETSGYIYPGGITVRRMNDYTERGHNWVTASRIAGVLTFLLTLTLILQWTNHILSRLWLKCQAWREHDLVVGLGWRGERLFENGGHCKSVIGVDTHPPETARFLSDQRRGSAILTRDANNADILRRTGIRKTARAFICTGCDETNIGVAHKLAELTLEKGISSAPRKLVCAVSLRNPDSHQMLVDSMPPGHHLDLRLFNTERATVRAFFRQHHLDRFQCSPNAAGARVVILGDSPMAEALTLEVMHHAIFEPDKRLDVIRLVADAEESARGFLERHPCFERDDSQASEVANDAIRLQPSAPWFAENVLPKVAFHRLPAQSAEQSRWMEVHLDGEANWVTTCIVAHEDPSLSYGCARAIGSALSAIQVRRNRDMTLWFLYNTPDEAIRHDVENALDKEFGSLHVQAFSDFMGICHRDRATGEEADRIARRLNAYYNKQSCEILRKETEVNKIWDETSESHRESSRAAADHAFVKLRIKQRLKKETTSTDPTTEINNKLACIEHRRWCAYHLLRGFEPLIARIPALHSPFKRTAEEKQLIDRWFGIGCNKEKNSFQGRFQHIDLIPWDDMSLLFENDLMPHKEGQPDIAIVELEQTKDDVTILEQLVYGVK